MSAAAGICPRCQARIDPWRILRMTRRTPYICPSCAGTSRLDSRTVIFLAAIAGALTIPFVFARVCRFDRAAHPPT
jgi:hypothetical protein